MSEKRSLSLPRWAIALLSLLVVAVSVQGFYLYRLESNNGKTGFTSGDDSVADNTTSPPAPPVTVTPNQAWTNPDPFDQQNWDPFAEMQRMREQMDQMFNNAFGKFQQSGRFNDLFDSQFPVSPNVDLQETKDAFEVTVDLPGAEKSNIKTTLKDNTLQIVAESDASKESNNNTSSGGQTLRKERWVGRFERSITLPQPIDASGMTTKYENGVLRIHIPKAKDDASSL
jgi:HSP20 family protein